jgi:predicted NBD/HSP70 family sugar kinase
LAQGEKTAAGTVARETFAVMGRALGRRLATLSNLLNLQKVILGEVIAYPLFRAELESSRRRYSFSTAADDCDLIVDPVDDHLWERERPAWQSSIWSARHGSDHSDRVPRSAGQHDDRFPEPTTGSEA